MYIELKDVCKEIKNTAVLTDISLRMEGGKVYGFRGKNGCGKTMIMRVISGLIRPTSGEVIIDNRTMWKDMTFPESIGILLENPSFLDGYTGFDNLKILASIKGGTDDIQIKDAMKKTGLNPDDNRKYKKYSLGMKQKLGIAAAFMENPDIVILDEPLNALDKEGVDNVRAIINELKHGGKITIIACHDAEEMELLADTIFEMENGKIVGK